MRALVLSACCAIAGAFATAAAAQDSPPAPRSFRIVCGELHIGNGEVLQRATIEVRDGVIAAIGVLPAGTAIEASEGTVIDASDKVVMPGIVVADTGLARTPDNLYNVTPDLVALEGFDFSRRHRRLLAGGVTTVYLSPGRNQFISGQGSVVKTTGDDLVERVLREYDCLRINMGDAALQSRAVFEPTVAPTSDDPLVPARKQYPTARISMLAELRAIFEEATASEADTGAGDTDGGLHGEGSAENRYTVLALQRAARGEIPLRISAQKAADIRRALEFARGQGTRLVLEQPSELDRLGDVVTDQVSAVFRIPVILGGSNPGGEDRAKRAPQPQPDQPAKAVAHGVRVALAPAADNQLADTLLAAAVAIRHGLTPAQAMKAITGDAAAILGVADRVGTLEVGKDADFLVLSGAPFAVGTMVEDTYVGGELAYEREVTSDTLAVRAGTIVTATGRTIHRGMLITSGGVIKDVGEDLAVPHGARMIDLGDAVMVPGFIDAYSHAGLSGDGSAIPSGAADNRIADIIDPDDPVLHQAAAAGLTTVLVSGTDAGEVSGRVAAIKTAAASRDTMVVKETAALRFVHDDIGPSAIKPLADAIGRGKAYIAKWQKYEKALAEFKAGGKPSNAPAPKEPNPEPAATDPLSGTWKSDLEVRPGMVLPIVLKLKLAGTTVTGTFAIQRGGRGPESEIENGKFEEGVLTMAVRMMRTVVAVEATVADDTMEGTIESPMGSLTFSATRSTGVTNGTAGGDGAGAGADEAKEPTKPMVDEAAEPLRALVEKRIPAVVRVNRAPAIRAVIELFEKEKLPFILTGVHDAIETPDLLGEGAPPVILGPDIVRRDGTKVINAGERLSDRGVAVAIGTGDTAGSRYLPMHTAFAVRYGMSPAEALKAMTIHAAEMFQIADRVGSLERGKDADFVVFDGSPLEMTSRVLMVVVNGRIVVDNREENK